MHAMLIQTETTPNPATLKFLPGQTVMGSGTRDFATPEEAEASPLAEAIFSTGDVEGVFFGRDFISVTAEDVRGSLPVHRGESLRLRVRPPEQLVQPYRLVVGEHAGDLGRLPAGDLDVHGRDQALQLDHIAQRGASQQLAVRFQPADPLAEPQSHHLGRGRRNAKPTHHRLVEVQIFPRLGRQLTQLRRVRPVSLPLRGPAEQVDSRQAAGVMVAQQDLKRSGHGATIPAATKPP